MRLSLRQEECLRMKMHKIMRLNMRAYYGGQIDVHQDFSEHQQTIWLILRRVFQKNDRAYQKSKN